MLHFIRYYCIVLCYSYTNLCLSTFPISLFRQFLEMKKARQQLQTEKSYEEIVRVYEKRTPNSGDETNTRQQPKYCYSESS